MNDLSVTVVGNCQARPVANYIASMCPGVSMLPEIIVHLSSLESATSDLEILDQAEYILAQSVQDGYHAEHLTTSALKERYGKKVLVWPNLFFNGNCADIFYLTSETGERLQGPLGPYHNLYIFRCWKNRISEAQVPDALEEMYRNDAETLLTSVEASMKVLKDRDDESDVAIVDHIKSEWRKKRLFFTFNHPTADLLIELSRQLADAASLTRTMDIDSSFDGEPLNPIVPATSKLLATILDLDYHITDTSKGMQIKLDDGKVDLSGKWLYSLEDFISQSYAAYDLQPASNSSVRYTPNYAA